VISSPARCRSRCMPDAASSSRNTPILLSSHVRLGTRQVFHPPATEPGYIRTAGGGNPAVLGPLSPLAVPLLLKPCSRDHPRAYGEHSASRRYMFSPTGSPPRVRGALWGWASSWCRTLDHPRVCREPSQIGLPTVSVIGSPPRVRGGTRIGTVNARSDVRITPARTGSTRAWPSARRGPAEHPACVQRSTLGQST
jgi:hypothetical protein